MDENASNKSRRKRIRRNPPQAEYATNAAAGDLFANQDLVTLNGKRITAEVEEKRLRKNDGNDGREKRDGARV